MISIVAAIIFLATSSVIVLMILRKIPALAELSVRPNEGRRFFERVRDSLQNNKKLKSISSEIFLQKLLSRLRILILKFDNKTSSWLMKLRQKSSEKKNGFSEDYWKKLKPK